MNNQFPSEMFEKYDIFLSDTQKKQLEDFFQILIEENQKYNLTRITSREEVFSKHFLDSLLGAKFIKENASCCDIGAGGGFPSIPLAIYRPDLKFLLCDSVGKKVNFLCETAKKLGLANVETIHSRIEELARSNKRSAFDVVLSRGVAPLPTLLEYKIPLAKVGGIALCYKGDVSEELENAKTAMKLLLCEEYQTFSFNISENMQTRTFLIVDKSVENSKSYPRTQNAPRLKPL